MLKNARLTAREPGCLRLETPNDFAAQRLRDRADELSKICGDFFGEPTRIEVAELAARRGRRAKPEKREDARKLRQEALNHPGVNHGPRDPGTPTSSRSGPSAAGREPRLTPPDLKDWLSKAQQMQGRLADMQRELAARRFEGSAGGGMVTAVASAASCA